MATSLKGTTFDAGSEEVEPTGCMFFSWSEDASATSMLEVVIFGG